MGSNNLDFLKPTTITEAFAQLESLEKGQAMVLCSTDPRAAITKGRAMDLLYTANKMCNAGKIILTSRRAGAYTVNFWETIAMGM